MYINDLGSAGPGEISPEQFMKLVSEASDEQIEQGLSENWDVAIEGIFDGMSEHFLPENAEGLDAVLEWRLTGKPDAENDRWQVVIKDKECKISRDSSETPSVSMELTGVDFVKLAAQKIVGPALFTSGRLKIEGDMTLAARFQILFKVPQAAA